LRVEGDQRMFASDPRIGQLQLAFERATDAQHIAAYAPLITLRLTARVDSDLNDENFMARSACRHHR